ncbi:MAG: IS5 family transposase [Deltaproteobacteria bacterium]|nr:IS5 family transposase [Deltaproteobacteria bacterium]
MRGINETQAYMFSYLSPEQRVPAKHPLRVIKVYADEILEKLSKEFNEMYSRMGRPSVPPERLLKAQLLIALYSVRSDRMFCEMLDYNILFRWFLGMNMEEASIDATTFTKNRDRLLEHRIAEKFFEAVVGYARQESLLSDEHFTVDGSLIEAWASMKSFRPKGEEPKDMPKTDNDKGNPTVDFRGEKRKNETHSCKSDPEALLMRKGKGKEAKLSYNAHAMMENRNGLLVGLKVSRATGTAERETAIDMIEEQKGKGIKVKTLGADKGYDTKEFIEKLREKEVTPHVAANEERRGGSAIDGRTTRHEGYAVSQKIRKRVEEIFGWFKTVGGFRRSRFRGRERTELQALLVGTAYNLMRMAKLLGREAEAV